MNIRGQLSHLKSDCTLARIKTVILSKILNKTISDETIKEIKTYILTLIREQCTNLRQHCVIIPKSNTFSSMKGTFLIKLGRAPPAHQMLSGHKLVLLIEIIEVIEIKIKAKNKKKMFVMFFSKKLI